MRSHCTELRLLHNVRVAQNHRNLRPKLLTVSPAFSGTRRLNNLLRPREVDHEVIAVELDHLADQIGTYVVGSGGASSQVRRESR